MEVRERLAKKMKWFSSHKHGRCGSNNINRKAFITEGVSIAEFAIGIGLPVGIALSRISLLLHFCDGNYTKIL